MRGNSKGDVITSIRQTMVNYGQTFEDHKCNFLMHKV